jgi:type IV secretory pathway component VirB8
MNAVLNRTVSLPKEDAHLEIQGSYIVINRLLRVALFAVILGLVGVSAVAYRLAVREPERIVVRVDSTGQAMVSPYASLVYQPREPEVRYFLSNFVRDHYGRVRATYKDAYQRKLFFLDPSLGRAVMDEETKNKSIAKFATSMDDEVEVFITQVTVADMRQAPYRATVEFDKVFMSAVDHHEMKREKWTAQFQFRFMPQVPNQYVQTNPLGMIVTYYRADQAFEKETN